MLVSFRFLSTLVSAFHFRSLVCSCFVSFIPVSSLAAIPLHSLLICISFSSSFFVVILRCSVSFHFSFPSVSFRFKIPLFLVLIFVLIPVVSSLMFAFRFIPRLVLFSTHFLPFPFHCLTFAPFSFRHGWFFLLVHSFVSVRFAYACRVCMCCVSCHVYVAGVVCCASCRVRRLCVVCRVACVCGVCVCVVSWVGVLCLWVCRVVS